MRKKINIWLVLLIALLFTGCKETMLPGENTDTTEQLLETEIQEEVKKEEVLESIDYEEKYDTSGLGTRKPTTARMRGQLICIGFLQVEKN